MNASGPFLGVVLVSAMALGIAPPAAAQAGGTPAAQPAPDFGSGAGAGSLSNSNYNTPESDGRPGVKFFAYGVAAFRKGDYQHALDMYKVAGSWAYKPAEYNLGVMYFKGEGVPVNRPLGAAWMVLAAERGEPMYVRARDQMVTLLTAAQFAATDALWNDLKRTYGDQVALRRAKAQWAWVKSHQTGTRVGGVAGELHVGALPSHVGGRPGKPGNAAMLRAGWGYLAGGSIDGSIAYGQFDQSADPYTPSFVRNRTGKATVGPLQPVKPDTPPAKSAHGNPLPASADSVHRSA